MRQQRGCHCGRRKHGQPPLPPALGSAEINRVEDLRGKSLGITRFGSLPHNLTVILLRKYGLATAVNMRQFGDTLGIAAAFEQHVIAGAVTSELRVRVPVKVLINLVDLGIPYSTNVIAVQRDFYRRSPKVVESMARAYTEGVAALKNATPKD